MSVYEAGYNYYVSKCRDFGLEPIQFHVFIMNLSEEQLQAFNEQARKWEG